ncbi:MAG TPA: B12-binding domain-containing radical SAM protein, partial [Firmicutes bacterium]|nr:B12-binding domain-containing radical SAM protein [Bacillota bacterium]
YPAIDELCEALMKLDVQISVASLRADSLTESLVAALARSGHKTITLAPEAGSERLRRVINKGVTEGDIIRAVKLARDHGI